MLKTILFVLGLVLIVLGTWRQVDPIGWFANSGIQLSNDVSLLNEIRGLDGPVVGFGILVMMGAFVRKLAFTSTIAAVVLFLSFGFARLFSVMLDGNPGETIIQGIAIEFVFGLFAVFALYKYRQKP